MHRGRWLETLNLILIYCLSDSKHDQSFPLTIFWECALVQKTQPNPTETIPREIRGKCYFIFPYFSLMYILKHTNKLCLVPTWAISRNWTCIDSRKTKQRTFSICVDMTPFVTLNAPHISNLRNSGSDFGY